MTKLLEHIKLIQGGMGVYVSNWRLAKAVAMQRPGETAGTVSGTALDVVYVRLLQLGDPGGHARRALQALDDTFDVAIGRDIRDRYFIEGGKPPDARFRSAPMQIIKATDGRRSFPLPDGATAATSFKLEDDVIELLIATGFAEVWLAKEGHPGRILINFLHKIELPLIYVLYGAMLAGVDGVVIGAGNPEGLPALCRQLAQHAAVTHKISLLYRETGEDFKLAFDPQQVAGGRFAAQPLAAPAFLAVVSLEELVKVLAESESLPPDGFIIEHHTAGGHNANPAGPMVKDATGQPIYGARDEADLAAILAVGIPFWLAGGYGSGPKLQEALAAGANGVQAGTVFALAEESGMKPEYRSAILEALKNGVADADLVHTTTFSPTGFAFKVVQLQDTVSADDIYESRRRVCDIGMLQQRGFNKPDEQGDRTLFQRCPAGPIETYIKKRGLEHNTDERRCLCNGLLSCVGLGQVKEVRGELVEEPAIVTLGNHLDGVRRLSRQGQTRYYVEDVVADILADAS
ncbi:nitronate monooxygenase [Promineifilum sp.]|uniref:nitronate monooxygenase n=1 Tax=Promineifilum sp. TaxID=2664178 RepID=UPI0035AFF69E